MINIIIVNDYFNIQGGTTKVVNNIIQNFTTSQDINKIYLFNGSLLRLHEGLEYPSNVEHFTTDQKEILNHHNILKGIGQGLWNIKMKNIVKSKFKNFNKLNTIVFIHGYMKILSPGIIQIFAKLGFQCVIMVHDYFISCPNGAYYDFQKQKVCNLKPLGSACFRTSCDSRSYLHKMFRYIRGIVQNRIINKYASNLHYIFVSQLLYNKITSLQDLKNKYVIENPPNLKPSLSKEISRNEYFLFVGRFSPEKGYDLILRWAVKLPHVKFVMVGNHAEKLISKDLANVKIKDWVNHKEIMHLYDNARCVIIPSKWDEPFGLVATEAASRGIPLLISKNIGASSYVEDGKSGYLIDVNNENDIIDKINSLNSDNDTITYFSLNIYKMYQEKYSTLQHYYESLLQILKDILDNNRLVKKV